MAALPVFAEILAVDLLLEQRIVHFCIQRRKDFFVDKVEIRLEDYHSLALQRRGDYNGRMASKLGEFFKRKSYLRIFSGRKKQI